MFIYYGFTPYDGEESRIFISAANPDIRLAQRISAPLERRGIRVFYHNGLLSGAELRSKTAERLENCTLFVAVISKNSFLKKSFQRIELSMAVQRKIPIVAVFADELTEADVPQMDRGMLERLQQGDRLTAAKKSDCKAATAKIEEKLNSLTELPPLKQRRKERRERSKALSPERRAKKMRLSRKSERQWRRAEKRRVRKDKRDAKREKRRLFFTRRKRRKELESVMNCLAAAQTVSECKALDNRISELGDVELVTWWLFNGEEEIQRNYAALYLRRKGEAEVIQKAFEQGKIDRIQAFSN